MAKSLQSHIRIAPLIVGIITTCLAAFLMLFIKPAYNADIFSYIGSAHKMLGYDAESIHRLTFQSIKAEMPEDALSANLEALAPVANDADRFYDILPFFLVKPLFPALLIAFNKLGFSWVDAAIIVPRIAALGTFSLIYSWSLRYLPVVLSVLLSISIMLLPEVYLTVKMSTPDTLAAFFILLFLFIFVEYRNNYLSLLVVPLCVLSRPDTIILFAAMLMVFYPVGDKKTQVTVVSSFIISLALFLTQSHLSGNYGWEALFYVSFVERWHDYKNFDPELSLYDYAGIYLRQAKEAAVSGMFRTNVAVAMIAVVVSLRCHTFSAPTVRLAFAILAFLIIHWFVFPSEKFRQVLGGFIAAILIVVLGIGARRSHTQPRT